MKIGYARVSKSDGSQSLDLQIDAIVKAGVDREAIYSDMASGKNAARPGLDSCIKALREGDKLIVWKLDRLGRNLQDLLTIVNSLSAQNIGFQVLTGSAADIDTSTASGKLMFHMFAVFADYERELISERTKAGLASARARGRVGGRRRKMTPSKIKTAKAAMAQPDCNISQLCKDLGVSRSTLYKHVPQG